MLEGLGCGEAGVFRGSIGEAFGLSVPLVYRLGGLNLLNGVAGGVAGRSEGRVS